VRQQHSYDLHLHSEWSWDASATLPSYLEVATARQMRCLAITDHDCWDVEHDIALQAPAYPNLRVIAGSEIYIRSEALDNKWIHFLCYGFPRKLPDELIQIQTTIRQWMHAGGLELCRSFSRRYGLGEEESSRIAWSCRPSKTHQVQGLTHANTVKIAAALRAAGIDASDDDARHIQAEMWAAMPEIPAALAIIPKLKKTDLVLVLAHPYYCYDGTKTDQLDLLREELQFDGIECAHHRIEQGHTEGLERYCRERNLLSTAGTDNHTEEGIASSLGVHYGSEAWLEPFLERLANS